MGFTKGLDPKVAMGLDVPTDKVREWIKSYKIAYSDSESIRRKVDEDGKEFYSITLKPDYEWNYGDIIIFFKFKFEKEVYKSNINKGFTRYLEPDVAMGYDTATEKVRGWIRKHGVPYFSPEEIRRKRNAKNEEYYRLTLIPNKDAWEYGDIEIIFLFNAVSK